MTTTTRRTPTEQTFNKPFIFRLHRRGVRVVGTQAIPDTSAMPYANAETGYSIDDNGTGRVVTIGELIALAK